MAEEDVAKALSVHMVFGSFAPPPNFVTDLDDIPSLTRAAAPIDDEPDLSNTSRDALIDMVQDAGTSPYTSSLAGVQHMLLQLHVARNMLSLCQDEQRKVAYRASISLLRAGLQLAVMNAMEEAAAAENQVAAAAGDLEAAAARDQEAAAAGHEEAAAAGDQEAAAPGDQEAAAVAAGCSSKRPEGSAPGNLEAAAAGKLGAAGLGPAGLSLVKQELGALPSQQQLQYWQLADAPYDGAQLQALVQRYLLPRQAETLIGRANRSGRARPAKVNVADVVQQQYPLLAPSLHGLLAQVQQQPHQQQPHSSRGKGNAAVLASTCAQSPAAVVLLRALRCLQLWESRQVTQPEMPTLLQRLAGVGGGTAAAAAADADVTEVMDLTGDDEDGSGEAAAGNVEQLQAFLAGEIDLLLVREQQGVGAGAAAAVRVKDEPLD